MLKKSKAEILDEAIEQIRALSERVRYKPDDLLPSQVRSGFASALHLAKEGDGENPGYGESPPEGWNSMIDDVRLLFTEAAKPFRIPGLIEHLYRKFEEDGSQLIEARQSRERDESSVSIGSAMKRLDFNRLNPAERMSFVKSGKRVVD